MLDLAAERRQHHAGGRAGVPCRRRRWRSASWPSCACRARSSAAPPTSAGSTTSKARRRPRSLRHSSLKAAQRLLEYTTKHYSSGNSRRNQGAAPPDDPGRHLSTRARLRYFFLGRTALAVGLAMLLFLFAADASPADRYSGCWSDSAASSATSGPASISTSASRRGRPSISAGFPDFMDLLVVCADAGLSMEASLDRVGRELSDSYPRSPPTCT